MGQNADGEPIGQPRRRNPDHRPNLPDSPSHLPADEIPASTKAKLLARYLNACKNAVGNAKWTALGAAGQAPLKEAAFVIWFDEIEGPNAWDMLTEERKTHFRNLLASPTLKPIFCERARKIFVCSEWNKLTEAQRKQRLDAKLDDELKRILGEDAFNDLNAEQKEQARRDLPDTLIKNMRCNIETALKMIECICPEVAKCLRAAWAKGRLCVDFNSGNSAGSMKVDPKGKAAGVCDPDSFPVNIALATFPKHKATSCFDPQLYFLFTTLLHEGVHTLQAIGARPAAPTAVQCADRYLEVVKNEREAHGKEDDFINKLCVPLNTLISGAVPAPTGEALVDKIAAKIAALHPAIRLAFALPLKAETLKNKILNANALATYNALANLANLLKAGTITKAEFNQRYAAMRKVIIIHKPQPGTEVLIGAGGESNVIEQERINFETAELVAQELTVPVSMVTESILIAGGQFLITFGNDDETGEGVIHAFQDQNGDGFFDAGSGQELMRHEVFFGALDAHYDLFSQHFVAVNLVSGEILELFHMNGQPLPDQFEPAGVMDFQDHAVRAVCVGDDGSSFIALPYIALPTAPVLLPGDVFPVSTLQLVDQQPLLLPSTPFELLEQSDFLPVFVSANELPILRPTSTINSLTNQLEVSGPLGSQLEIFLLPETLLGTVALEADTRQVFSFEQQLVPGDVLIIFNPETGAESIPYFVQDPAPYFVDSLWLPGEGLQLTLFGIPGMQYQLLGSPDLIDPQPLGPPLMALDGPLVIPPDPSITGPQFFWQAMTLPPLGAQ